MIGLTTRSFQLTISIFKFTQKEIRKSMLYQYKNPNKTGIRGYVVIFYRESLFSKSVINKKDQLVIETLNKGVRRKFSIEENVHLINFEKVSTETLESLSEYFDEIIEKAAHLQDADVSYGDGVLTIKFGGGYGTYVINRQIPNQQIWLSSPKSGPKRYDFINRTWIYKHDGKSLHELLNEEIPNIVKFPVSFNKCSYCDILKQRNCENNVAYEKQNKISKEFQEMFNDVSMEIMEDGNLVDRVRILLQRDMQYYQEMQTVLREPLCIRVSGGKFDFPRHASFVAIKIVIWWEAEFVVAFKRVSGLSSANQDNIENTDDNGVVKKTQPSEFILLVIETSEQLLEHLHKLIQESLDHADLTVLTATLGAAALIRNCLWCYNQCVKTEIRQISSAKLFKCYKSYDEITEAVAERLLDLHCRLISLYILNEADSLNWQSDRPFLEKERCSYVIQMWWLYMQGTKTDLWNTVSPKMAQRIFSGMLNESLSIIVTRFIHGRPSLARSVQFWADAFNVLSCTAYLSLDVCVSGDDMIGLNVKKLSTYVRDIHAKCNELLICFLLRGAPLKILFQVFRKGLENLTISKPRYGPSPWLYVCAPNLLGISQIISKEFQNLTGDQTVILELNVLKSQPQPNWTQLIKVLSMNNYSLAKLLLGILVRQCMENMCNDSVTSPDLRFSIAKIKETVNKKEEDNCGGFLCTKKCWCILSITPAMGLHGLVFILLNTTCDPTQVILPAIKQDPAWSTYLDRQQVWNQKRPPWLNALLDFLRPIMKPIVDTLLKAVKTGASIYQAMSLALGCLGELHECLSLGVLQMALAMDENVPAHCRPIGGSVLLQIMCSALYSALIDVSVFTRDLTMQGAAEQQRLQTEDRIQEPETSSFDPQDRSASAIALSEALCSIDEDNKHTAQIDDLLGIVRKSVKRREAATCLDDVKDMMCIIETYTDQLAFTEIGRRSLKIMYEYLLRTSKALLDILKLDRSNIPDSRFMALYPVPNKPLTYTMFHIGETAFDRLLFNYDDIDWELMFEIPLSLPIQRIRTQVLSRPELINILQLEQDEREAANFIKQLCTTGVLTRRN